MTTRPPVPTESIECPLCLGAGNLKRTEILDRLGVKDFARVAQLSAEEAFRLLQNRHDHEHQQVWSRFETELAKRTAEIRDRHKDELRLAQSDRDDLTRRVEDCLREVAQLRERNHELETEMAKVARVGKREEISFAEEARTWAGIVVSEKLPRNGDFILAYRDPSGAPLEPCILVDNKDKTTISEGDIRKALPSTLTFIAVQSAITAQTISVEKLKAPYTHPHPRASAQAAPEPGIAAASCHERPSVRKDNIASREFSIRNRPPRERSSPTPIGCCR